MKLQRKKRNFMTSPAKMRRLRIYRFRATTGEDSPKLKQHIGFLHAVTFQR